jgi:sugar (pentulose or hexulose) kinase
MGRPLQVVEHPLEAGAMGAALTVAVGMRVYPNMDAIDELIHIDHTVEPRPGLERRYGRMYEDYRQVYEALAPVFRRMHTTP